MAPFLDLFEAAERLGMDLEQVEALCQDGLLPGALLVTAQGDWAIPQEAVEDWLSQASGEPPVSTTETGEAYQIGDIQDSNIAVGRDSIVSNRQGPESEMRSDALPGNPTGSDEPGDL